MTSKLRSVTVKSSGQYKVELEVLGTGQRLFFDFEVDCRDNIEVVKWSEEFAAYMSLNLGPASPIMEVVLQLHHAQRVEYP